eukprot:m51a1_g6232 hypothetical protein (522) ;mRNA; f:267359-269803
MCTALERTAAVADYRRSFYGEPVPIVIDNGTPPPPPSPAPLTASLPGSWQCRAGWATETAPRHTIEAMSGASWAFDKGVVVDFAAQERVLDAAFGRLGVDTATLDHPVLITEPPCNPNSARARLNELLFETYGAPSVCVGIDALFSFIRNRLQWAVDPREALIVSSGMATTHVIPVCNSSWRPQRSFRIDVGGEHATQVLRAGLHARYPKLPRLVPRDICDNIKRAHAYVAMSYAEDALRYAAGGTELAQGMRAVQFQPQIDPAQQRDRKETEEKLNLYRSVRQLKRIDRDQFKRQLEALKMNEHELKNAISGLKAALSRPMRTPHHREEDRPPLPSDIQPLVLNRQLALSKLLIGCQTLTPQEACTVLAPDLDDPPSAGGITLVVGTERSRAGEVLFQPSLAGCPQVGLAEAVALSLAKFNPDTQFTMAQTVFLTGGNCLLPGLSERLHAELTSLLPEGTPVRVVMAKDPLLDSWKGAAQFASDPRFAGDSSLTRAKYLEMGPDYLQQNCASNVYIPKPK